MRKASKFVVAICIMFLAYGCAAWDQAAWEQQQAARDQQIDAMRKQQAEFLQQFNETIPICNGGQDCKDKWIAAQIWVARNCDMKIQLATDAIIETYASLYDYELTARVIKELIGNGRYRIVISTGGKNSRAAALDFNRYIGTINGRSQDRRE